MSNSLLANGTSAEHTTRKLRGADKVTAPSNSRTSNQRVIKRSLYDVQFCPDIKRDQKQSSKPQSTTAGHREDVNTTTLKFLHDNEHFADILAAQTQAHGEWSMKQREDRIKTPIGQCDLLSPRVGDQAQPVNKNPRDMDSFLSQVGTWSQSSESEREMLVLRRTQREQTRPTQQRDPTRHAAKSVGPWF